MGPFRYILKFSLIVWPRGEEISKHGSLIPLLVSSKPPYQAEYFYIYRKLSIQDWSVEATDYLRPMWSKWIPYF